jgi:hypothetical protein
MRAHWFTTRGLIALLVPAVLIGTGSASASTDTSWTVTETPNPGSTFNELNGVAATFPHNAWAVGDYSDGTFDQTQTLIEHWDGSTWSQVPSPSAGSLIGVAATSPNNAVAVGTNGSETLALNCC